MPPVARYAADVRRSTADISAARRAATGWLAQEAGRPVDDSCVVLGELLNNAFMHTTGDIRLRLGWQDGVVTVEVWDEAPSLRPTPRPTDLAGLAPHGRGLLMVAGLAEDWGTRRQDGGKVVWAHVREDATPSGQLDGHDRAAADL